MKWLKAVLDFFESPSSKYMREFREWDKKVPDHFGIGKVDCDCGFSLRLNTVPPIGMSMSMSGKCPQCGKKLEVVADKA